MKGEKRVCKKFTLNEYCIKWLQHYADKYCVSKSIVLENMITQYVAYEDCVKAIVGKDPGGAGAFIYQNGKLLSGEDLLRYHVETESTLLKWQQEYIGQNK
jgi:hypothetical protein